VTPDDDIPVPKHVDPSEVKAEVPESPESGELQESWDSLKEALQLPHLSDDELRTFVDDFVSDRIFTTGHLRDGQEDRVPMIFLPVAMGCFKKVQPDSLSTIGCLWEYHSEALPRSINGLPCFMSFKMLHKDDWERAKVAIDRELDRRKNIPL
jgi:hypothetical protein